MSRKAERLNMQDVEAYILRFGPLTSPQIRTHFGCDSGNFRSIMKKSKVLRSSTKGSGTYSRFRSLIWYHIDGNKPEGVTE